jgi:hypothetical protein
MWRLSGPPPSTRRLSDLLRLSDLSDLSVPSVPSFQSLHHDRHRWTYLTLPHSSKSSKIPVIQRALVAILPRFSVVSARARSSVTDRIHVDALGMRGLGIGRPPMADRWAIESTVRTVRDPVSIVGRSSNLCRQWCWLCSYGCLGRLDRQAIEQPSSLRECEVASDHGLDRQAIEQPSAQNIVTIQLSSHITDRERL